MKILMKRECYIELDICNGYPEHELMLHYDKLHDELIQICKKSKKINIAGIIFIMNVKKAERGFIETKHIYLDYSDINNDNSKDQDDDKEELKEIINELKYVIIIKLKKEIKKDLKDNITKILIKKIYRIIDELIYSQHDRCKTTTNNFIKNTSISIKCKDIESKICPICKLHKSCTDFYSKGHTCIACL